MIGGFRVVDKSIAKVYRYLKRLVVYEPPQEAKPFVLGEPECDSQPPANKTVRSFDELEQFKAHIDYGRTLAETMEQAGQILAANPVDGQAVAKYKQFVQAMEKQYEELSPLLLAYTVGLDDIDRPVSSSLKDNKRVITSLYHGHTNKDLLFRDFSLPGEPARAATLVFLDGMIDKQLIDLAILQPLMLLCAQQTDGIGEALLHRLAQACLPSNEAAVVTTYQAIVDGVNSGDTALLVDGAPGAIVLATKGYQQRGVERPQNEQTVRGAQVAFSEGLRTNTALIRTALPSQDLVTEIIMVGDRVKQKCAVIYMQNLANEDLVTEVKRRIKSIRASHIPNVSTLEQFIEDHPGIPFPQSLSTERPDRVVASLMEGKVALLYEGAPLALVLPVSFFTLFHSGEDFTYPDIVTSFMRLLRLAGAAIATLLPSVYLAISYFHQEAMPTELVLAIAGAREKVPFPTLLELLIMDLSFELIREASLRIPGNLGSTIGIVGAIILGQAAVTANLVSPIMVVVIAISGLASFTIPDFRLTTTLRVLRFGILLMAATFGLVGIAFAILLLSTVLCSMKSFGVPYMVPVAPKTMSGLDVVIKGPVFHQERLPDYLNPKDQNRQPPVARKWTKERSTKPGGDDS